MFVVTKRQLSHIIYSWIVFIKNINFAFNKTFQGNIYELYNNSIGEIYAYKNVIRNGIVSCRHHIFTKLHVLKNLINAPSFAMKFSSMLYHKTANLC